MWLTVKDPSTNLLTEALSTKKKKCSTQKTPLSNIIQKSVIHLKVPLTTVTAAVSEACNQKEDVVTLPITLTEEMIQQFSEAIFTHGASHSPACVSTSTSKNALNPNVMLGSQT